jgi:DNA-directed RNA polymerase subunit RPC12/RpoP
MEGIKMTWHCKSCNRNFIRDPGTERTKEIIDGEPKILFCPYCNSDKIENISDSKK